MFLASDGICSPSRQLSYPGPSSRSRPPHRPAQLTAAISPGKTERIKCDECLLHFQLAEEQRGGFHLSSRMQNHKPPRACARDSWYVSLLIAILPMRTHPQFFDSRDAQLLQALLKMEYMKIQNWRIWRCLLAALQHASLPSVKFWKSSDKSGMGLCDARIWSPLVTCQPFQPLPTPTNLLALDRPETGVRKS